MIIVFMHVFTLLLQQAMRKFLHFNRNFLIFSSLQLNILYSLKPLDIEFMRRLHTRVNLIPIIAKADTMTEEEVVKFKERILADINYHQIQIYQAPVYEYDDMETIAENSEIMSKIPFAVVGSDKEFEIENVSHRRVRGRKYPWGVIEVDNEEHCDFVKLRQMLIR
jgi:septin 7